MKCISCGNTICSIYNNIQICNCCYIKLTSYNCTNTIHNRLKELKTDIIISEWNRIKSLKLITQYESLEYIVHSDEGEKLLEQRIYPNNKLRDITHPIHTVDMDDKSHHIDFPKKLIFVPREICNKKREIKQNLKQQNKILDAEITLAIIIVDNNIFNLRIYLEKFQMFRKTVRIIELESELTLATNMLNTVHQSWQKLIRVVQSSPKLLALPQRCLYSFAMRVVYKKELSICDYTSINKTLIHDYDVLKKLSIKTLCIKTEIENVIACKLAKIEKKIMIKDFKNTEIHNHVKKRLDQNAQKHTNNKNVKSYRITQPRCRNNK